MKRVGVREFRDHATQYLASREPLEIERHGRPIGFYIPLKQANDEEVRHAVARLREAVEQVLAETGMTEDELAALFDLKRPL
jgi:antitoxin (DNA-binding transcriptional repressor) of toxin-antitoxin stability system